MSLQELVQYGAQQIYLIGNPILTIRRNSNRSSNRRNSNRNSNRRRRSILDNNDLYSTTHVSTNNNHDTIDVDDEYVSPLGEPGETIITPLPTEARSDNFDIDDGTFGPRNDDDRTINFDNLVSKIIEDSDVNECSICYDKQSNIITDCGHQFCKDCIDKWVNTNSKKHCPYCRTDLTKNKIFFF